MRLEKLRNRRESCAIVRYEQISLHTHVCQPHHWNVQTSETIMQARMDEQR
jgi:hypothetical protein